MANPPELVEAFKLIKAGQKTEAGQILKAYLAQNKQDVQAWWLMAHAVTKPDVIQRCLETILKLDPNHEKARAQLAKLTGHSAPPVAQTAPPPEPPPAPMPADDPFAPTADDPANDPFASAQAAPADDPFAPTSDDPFAPTAAAPADDPFAPDPATPADDPFAPTADDPFAPDSGAADDPFASAPADDDPFAPDPAQAAPVDEYGFPDDALVLAGVLPAAEPVPATPDPELAPAEDTASADTPASFEDFLTNDTSDDPFAGPPVDDPFDQPTASEDLFATSAGIQSTTASSGPAPAPPPPQSAKPPGENLDFEVYDGGEITGAPPSGVPGKAVPILSDDDLRVTKRKRGGGAGGIVSILTIGVVVFIILLGIFIFAAAENGLIDLPGIGGERVPSMTTMDASTFTMSIPKNWDQTCLTDSYGYPVCGVANHRWYNQADLFAGSQVDLGSMVGEMISMSVTGEDLPDERFSIIAMDVLDYSPSYDNSSWAKSMYEADQSWGWGAGKSNYDKYETEIEGQKAYYYEYVSTGDWKEAAWDVYIPHDGRVFWLRVDYYGDRKHEVPYKTVAKMIESIEFKS